MKLFEFCPLRAAVLLQAVLRTQAFACLNIPTSVFPEHGLDHLDGYDLGNVILRGQLVIRLVIKEGLYVHALVEGDHLVALDLVRGISFLKVVSQQCERVGYFHD
jgi:hypothetical protein